MLCTGVDWRRQSRRRCCLSSSWCAYAALTVRCCRSQAAEARSAAIASALRIPAASSFCHCPHHRLCRHRRRRRRSTRGRSAQSIELRTRRVHVRSALMLSASVASAVVYILSGILWRAGSGACINAMAWVGRALLVRSDGRATVRRYGRCVRVVYAACSASQTGVTQHT